MKPKIDPHFKPNRPPTQEHRLDIELKPPLSLLMYESAFGSVAIYVSGDWRSRAKRALGHLFGKASWQISGMAFCPYHPIELSAESIDAMEVALSEKTKDRFN